jgi:hypothetical protein
VAAIRVPGRRRRVSVLHCLTPLSAPSVGAVVSKALRLRLAAEAVESMGFGLCRSTTVASVMAGAQREVTASQLLDSVRPGWIRGAVQVPDWIVI